MTAWRAFDVDVDLPDWWTVWMGTLSATPPDPLGVPVAMRRAEVPAAESRERLLLFVLLPYATVYESLMEDVTAAETFRRLRRILDAVGPAALGPLGSVEGAAMALLRALESQP